MKMNRKKMVRMGLLLSLLIVGLVMSNCTFVLGCHSGSAGGDSGTSPGGNTSSGNNGGNGGGGGNGSAPSAPSGPSSNSPSGGGAAPVDEHHYLKAVESRKIMKAIEKTGKAVIYGIYFDFDRADIRPDSEPTLSAIAEVLKEDPSLKIYVVGHADIIGDFNYNIKLSHDRAAADCQALNRQYGISRNRLGAYGLGQVAPSDRNDTDEGRAKNRRAELVKMAN
jgi:outer membrane protein OmpA-like peptidoglycan-associated protein